MTSGSLFSFLRRIYWATLPFEGWTADYGDDGNPCPWWAHPLAWINRLLDKALSRTRDGIWGPRFTAWSYRPLVGSTKPETWQ